MAFCRFPTNQPAEERPLEPKPPRLVVDEPMVFPLRDGDELVAPL